MTMSSQTKLLQDTEVVGVLVKALLHLNSTHKFVTRDQPLVSSCGSDGGITAIGGRQSGDRACRGGGCSFCPACCSDVAEDPDCSRGALPAVLFPRSAAHLSWDEMMLDGSISCVADA